MITKKNRVVISKNEFNGDKDTSTESLEKLIKLGALVSFFSSAGLLCVKAVRHFKKYPININKIKRKIKDDSN